MKARPPTMIQGNQGGIIVKEWKKVDGMWHVRSWALAQDIVTSSTSARGKSMSWALAQNIVIPIPYRLILSIQRILQRIHILHTQRNSLFF